MPNDNVDWGSPSDIRAALKDGRTNPDEINRRIREAGLSREQELVLRMDLGLTVEPGTPLGDKFRWSGGCDPDPHGRHYPETH